MADFSVYILFLAVALIVSLDVAGLTISKAASLRGHPGQKLAWALVNGFWHALLLAVYAFTLVGLLRIFTVDFSVIVRFFDWLLTIIQLVLPSWDIRIPLHEVLAFVHTHVPVLFGLLALTIIWQTYDAKIVSTPVTGDWRDLPPVARLIYDLIELLARIVEYLLRLIPLRLIPPRLVNRDRAWVGNFLRWQAEAALVAVDMLALAVLMVKMNYIDNDFDKWVLIVLVFATVSLLALKVADWSIKLIEGTPVVSDPASRKAVTAERKLAKAESDWWQVAFRLMEPWFIFYFALELIGYLLFGHPVHSVGFIFGASLLLFALIQKHKMRAIITAATTPHEGKADAASAAASRSLRDIGGDFAHVGRVLLIAAGIAIVVILALAGVWTIVSEWLAQRLELDAALIGMIGSFSVILLGISLFRPKFYVHFGRAFDWLIEHRKVFPFFVGALVVASIVPIYEQISEQQGDMAFNAGLQGLCRIVELGFQPNHMHALQISIIFVALWLFAWYLSRRFDTLKVKLAEEGRELNWVSLIEQSGTVPHNKLDVRDVIQMLMALFILACAALAFLMQTVYHRVQPCFDTLSRKQIVASVQLAQAPQPPIPVPVLRFREPR